MDAGIGAVASGLAGGLLASGGEAAESALAGCAVDEAGAAGDGSAAAAGESGAVASGDPGGGGTGGDGGAAGGGGDGEGGGGSCATAGGQSFAAGTLVVLASGRAVPISSLSKGEKVLAADTRTGKNQAEAVAAVLVRHDTDLYDLRVKSAGRTEVIDTTTRHLFWDPYLDKGWIPAKRLKPGMHLKTPDGQSAVVVGGWVPAVHNGWMWDLTVPGNNDHDFYVLAGSLRQLGTGRHTYHAVAGDTPVLVHNSSCPNPPSRGSTGRTTPGGANEDQAMQLVKEYPEYGTRLPTTMNDPRWLADDGWVKMEQTVNGVEIHYVYNTITEVADDFKFKDWSQ